MLFNSFAFLAFFAVVTTLYYLAPHRYRWPLLLVAGLYFYAAFSTSYLLLLLLVTGVAYVAGRAIGSAPDRRTRRMYLATGVTLVVGALLFFKYYDFFVTSVDDALAAVGIGRSEPLFPRLDLILVVGLSFYTFSCVSYLADVYNERIAPERHFGHFALYVSFFPKLIAGPIERAKPFLEQIRRPVRFSAVGVTVGLQLMLWGLFKKVVIADHLAGFVDGVYGQAAFASPADLVIATYFFAFQLYCDFSGYSDMAIGAAKVLGINLMDNFRRPYLSASTREFWAKRWHLSLATWFRDYMYIPLGGNRVSVPRQTGNVLLVFMVSGLWHGAAWTFVIWGGLNGLYHVASVVTRRLRDGAARLLRVPARLRHVWGVFVTFHLILVTWVFFRAESLADATTILSRVWASLGTLPSLIQTRLMAGEVLYGFGLIILLMGIEIVDERKPMWERLEARPAYVRWAVYYAFIVGLLVFGAWELQDFVYMQF